MVKWIESFYSNLHTFFNADTPGFNFIERKNYYEVEFSWYDSEIKGNEKIEYIKKFIESNYDYPKFEWYNDMI